MTLRLLTIFAALTVANFVYQAAASANYGAALERSFFEGVALMVVWLNLRFAPPVTK